MIGFLVGSGFYDLHGFESHTQLTSYGEVEVLKGQLNGSDCIVLPRHGSGHAYLPNHIPHKAHLMALKELGCDQIISFSVCGMIDPDLPLAEPLLVNDLLYLDNRLPDGSMCTFFEAPREPGRGHLICESYFHSQLMAQVEAIYPGIKKATYQYSIGPRFNSKAEIKAFRQQGATVISQTCGPEAVLANELEIPYALVVFPIDYANGVKRENTSMTELEENLHKSKDFFERIMKYMVNTETDLEFEGFLYRFE